jgi:hypothetical protein
MIPWQSAVMPAKVRFCPVPKARYPALCGAAKMLKNNGEMTLLLPMGKSHASSFSGSHVDRKFHRQRSDKGVRGADMRH